MTDVLTWKNPAVTVTFLVVVNLAYLLFRSFNISIMSYVSNKMFMFTLFVIAKQQLVGESKDCNKWFSKEKIESNYTNVYDKINKRLDHLRRIILLNDIPSLVRLLVSLIFIIFFGNCFTSLSLIVVAFNFYVLYNFGTVRDRVRQYSTIAIEITSKIISDNIPKFKESS